MTVGGLFEGIGGFPLAAQWAGFEPVWSNEIDPFCCQVLRKNFKHRIIEDDIRNIGKHNLEPVDILTGGFPCQDISIAGKGKGITGERSGLWASYYSIIDQLRPSYVVIENSTELLKKGFEKVLYPLSEIGYNVEWDCIRADEFGFPHQRNRVFIVAYSNGIGRICVADIFGRLQKNVSWDHLQNPEANLLLSLERFDRTGNYDVVRMDNGFSKELDRGRLKVAGNAIVPQVALEIFKAIKEVEKIVD